MSIEDQLDQLLGRYATIPTVIAREQPNFDNAARQFRGKSTTFASFMQAGVDLKIRCNFGMEPDDLSRSVTRMSFFNSLKPYPSAVYEKYFWLHLEGGEEGFIRRFIEQQVRTLEDSLAYGYTAEFGKAYRALDIHEQLAVQQAYAARVETMFVRGKSMGPWVDFPATLREQWRLWVQFKNQVGASALS